MPAEAGIVDSAVSFTKGCYIGQETVARLHYKGKPNRHLRGLRLSGPAVRAVSAIAEVAGNYRLAVSAKAGGAAARALRRRGSATVGIWVRFTSPEGVRHASRMVRLFARPN